MHPNVAASSSPQRPKLLQKLPLPNRMSSHGNGKPDVDKRYQHLIKLEGGKVRCTLCNSLYSCLVSARAHTVRVHEQPEYFECCFCKKIFRTKLNFRSHLNLSHGVKGSNLVASYGRLVDETEFADQSAGLADQNASSFDPLVEGAAAAEVIIDTLPE